jgi:hypothetical protein
MLLAPTLILLGLLGPTAVYQWQQGKWLASGLWILRTFSAHAVNGVAFIGVSVSLLGVSILWPPAIVLTFLSAVTFLGVLVASVNGNAESHLPSGLRAGQGPDPEAKPEPAQDDQRRAG